MTKKRNCYIYTRVSTAMQVDGYSLDAQKEKLKKYAAYEEMDMTTRPFKNVHYYYYYPFSEKGKAWNTYYDYDAVQHNIEIGKAHMFKYEYQHDKDNLDLMFASLDDPTQTMDAIISYIISGRGGFDKLNSWKAFLDEVHKYGEAGNNERDKEITVQSWRKFERIVKNLFITIIFLEI